MPRDRSRSPRRKDRRRSRSKEKERKPEDGEKKLDKFGRDVTSRPTERYGSSRGFREESSSSSRRREEPRDHRRDNRNNRDEEKKYDRYQSSSSQQDGYGEYSNNEFENNSRPDTSANSYNDDDARHQAIEKLESPDDGVDEETRKMQKLMGIGGFETTKNKKVANNVGGYAKVNKTQKYRQYMNRRGGFNRPLDYVQ